jgi:hypothetical protein
MKFVAFIAAPLIVASTVGTAFAKVPYFAAKCPTDISVETDRAGRAYLNGKRATVRSKNANYSEIVGGGVTISVAKNAGELIVSYTGRNRAHGVCQVVEQETVESAAPEAAKPEPTKAYDDVPKRDKQACLKAVKRKTHNPKAVVMDAVSSEANNTVTVGVGAEKAPWRCLVKGGKVADVMSQTNEGGL